MGSSEYCSIDGLMERGVKQKSGRRSTVSDYERAVFNQTNICIVSKAILGRLLRNGTECVRAFTSSMMPFPAEAGNWNWICRGAQGQRKAKPVGCIFLLTLRLNGIKFSAVMKQSKLNTLIRRFSDFFSITGNLCVRNFKDGMHSDVFQPIWFKLGILVVV